MTDRDSRWSVGADRNTTAAPDPAAARYRSRCGGPRAGSDDPRDGREGGDDRQLTVGSADASRGGSWAPVRVATTAATITHGPVAGTVQRVASPPTASRRAANIATEATDAVGAVPGYRNESTGGEIPGEALVAALAVTVAPAPAPVSVVSIDARRYVGGERRGG
ncbi:hypothetical protein BRD05_09375 [Halobacteriales archaeon QS_9_70_65]|nr:MAG: hypothetical protein BRD05_09375 [Halobacteriales archaeon QS_9_70_65]